ncbi:MAG: ABC transporter substrate-binding protein [Thermodesulfobacteriota bacterium]|nr:ABC transporter substrate-binding protein [Thermodesulfobacteriota bacterium]
MTVRRFLIFAPTVVILFLLQSYFWVPTYEEQTRGNPGRLHEYIAASIGDASILNPILSADSASSDIESMVFEGLIDRDEELRFRGRLATSWELYEEAFLCVNEAASVPALGRVGGREVADLIQKARDGQLAVGAEVKASLDNIKEIAILPAREFSVVRLEKGDKEDAETEVTIKVAAPERLKLVLNNVDQDLFANLSSILGKDYFSSFRGKERVTVAQEAWEGKRAEYAKEMLPATEHNPVVVFHLRPGVKFHDGHLFDANDVKFTLEAIMDPKNLSPRVSDYEPVKGVEVIDPLTVRVVYKRLYSPALGTWGMAVLPEHLLNDQALKEEALGLGKAPEDFSMRQSRFCRHPIGCGPFVFREWKSDQYILLDSFQDYWEGAPNYNRYTYRIVPDLLTQEMEFYAGTIDSYSVQPHQVKRLKQDPQYQNFSGLSFGYTYIGYNMRREPFNDLRVRRALGMAIDVDKIIAYVLYGQGERITGPFVKQTDYYNGTIKPPPYDPEGALKLLKEAGWERGPEGWLEKDGARLQFTLITNSGNDLRKAILAIAQDGWKRIGIDVKTDLLEWAVFIQERVNKADFDALVLGWSMGIEPDLYQIWHSSQSNPHQLNFVGFQNQEADDLIIRIRQEYDHQAQVAYCHRLHEIIAQEQPYTFLYVGKWTALLDKRIVILEKDEEGNPFYRKITPTKTGSFTFYFNKWIKLSEMPTFAVEG